MPENIYEGHTELVGVDTQSDAMYLPPTAVSLAVNRSFRGKINKTRPPIREIRLIFENDKDKEIFQKGNVQGIHGYIKTSSFTYPGLLVSISGVIFFVEVGGEIASVTRIFSGNDPFSMQAFFAQGQEQVYIQNGFNDPVAWSGQFLADGSPDVRVISGALDEGKPVMPIGNIMAYVHGRIAVANDNNQIAVSDHFNGAGSGTRRNMDNFTENTAWIGGFFTPPSELGRICALVPMPVADNRYGQAELVVACELGFASLDLSADRDQWRDARITFKGAGSYSPFSFTAANSDLWYRGHDGVRSFRQSRTDELREWGDTPLSREVSYWVDRDTPHLLRFCSSEHFDNKLYFTVYPETSESEIGFGNHWYHNGVVVLDFDRNSTVNPDVGFGWDGLWTGIRPTQLATVIVDDSPRLFTLARDIDDITRLYEFSPSSSKGGDGYYDDDGRWTERPIRSFYITKKYHEFGGAGNLRTTKRFIGGGRTRMRWTGFMSREISYRPDEYPCWFSLGKFDHGCNTCTTDCGTDVRRMFYKDFALQTPDDDECQDPLGSKARYGTSFQFLIEMEGYVEVPFFSFAAHQERDREDAECEDVEEWCDQIKCCDHPSFNYNLRDDG